MGQEILIASPVAIQLTSMRQNNVLINAETTNGVFTKKESVRNTADSQVSLTSLKEHAKCVI